MDAVIWALREFRTASDERAGPGNVEYHEPLQNAEDACGRLDCKSRIRSYTYNLAIP